MVPAAGELVQSVTIDVQLYGTSRVIVTTPDVVAAPKVHEASLGSPPTPTAMAPPDGHDPPSAFAPEKTKYHALGPGSFIEVKLIWT